MARTTGASMPAMIRATPAAPVMVSLCAVKSCPSIGFAGAVGLADGAAVDRDDRPGDVLAQVGDEELDDPGAVLGGPQAAQRHLLDDALDPGGFERGQQPPGRDEAGGDAVGGDPERAELLGQVAGVHLDA